MIELWRRTSPQDKATLPHAQPRLDSGGGQSPLETLQTAHGNASFRRRQSQGFASDAAIVTIAGTGVQVAFSMLKNGPADDETVPFPAAACERATGPLCRIGGVCLHVPSPLVPCASNPFLDGFHFCLALFIEIFLPFLLPPTLDYPITHSRR